MPQSAIDASKEPMVSPDDAMEFSTAYANARENGLDCEFLTWYNAGIRQGMSLDTAALQASLEWDLL